jgi:hypothetical protein
MYRPARHIVALRSAKIALRVALALGLAAAVVPAPGQSAYPLCAPAKLHPWGSCHPGTWKLVRIVTESLDENGHVIGSNTTDTKTTLTGVDRDGVTLEIQASMEVAGKRFQGEPQTVKQGFHGESSDARLAPVQPADAAVVIEGRKIPCTVQQWETAGSNESTVTTLYCSATVSPYVLKRQTVVRDAEGKNVISETLTEVTALDMPVRVKNEIRNGYYLRTVHRNGKGTVTTLAVALADVPGGVFSHSLKEVDPSGRLVRRSTLELIDYNTDPEKERTGMFNRRRPGRRAKMGSRCERS